MKKSDITPELVARLIADQFPLWAGLAIRSVEPSGSDNITFRLGDTLSVRLPRAAAFAAQVDKEQRWLPVLAGQLPLAIPEPVALGHPNRWFPWPWSIYRWLEGEPATVGRISDLKVFAAELARFLGTLYRIDAGGGPPAGEHNFFRGGPLDVYDEQTRHSIQLVAGEIDAEAAVEVWEASLASKWDRPPVWIHGDVAPANLLVVDGVLRAVIDFGCTAVGDPACDLAIAWTFFTDGNRQVFHRRLGLDSGTWARGRGWALWKALMTLAAEKKRHSDGRIAALRFGWRLNPRTLIEEVLADHRKCLT
ncbi:MAG TPA: aminoglycoside phosphotransferase family protein [Acidimicrobiales bacterium]|nr:aminoglycoside phosphotransferase family protein [Acidimicrobiales bacterium]